MHLRSTFTCIALTLLLETPTLLAEKPEMPDSAQVAFTRNSFPRRHAAWVRRFPTAKHGRILPNGPIAWARLKRTPRPHSRRRCRN